MKYPFTAGPWEVVSGMVQTKAEHKCKTPGCGVHIPIAYMDRKPGNGTQPCERDSNAHLIACTPELFELAKLIRGYFEQAGYHVVPVHGLAGKELLDRARTLIARVEKQTE
jgi:hypothetical protein